MIELKVKAVSPLMGTKFPLPAYATAGAAAMDLCACMEEPVTLAPGGRQGIPTGIAIALPGPEYVALVCSRSGMGTRHGITLSNSVGVIDSDYRGQLTVGLVNHGDVPYTIQPGDRIPADGAAHSAAHPDGSRGTGRDGAGLRRLRLHREVRVMARIILASGSPRRQELLQRIGLREFEISVPDVEEWYPPELAPEDIVAYISREKSQAVQAPADAIVITADTMVFLDDQRLGKPHDEAEALSMLTALSGRKHKVCTGVTVRQGEKALTRAQSTDVYFREASRQELLAYIRGGEPMDKAGAYGVQGQGALLVERIDGDFFNVMGLPVVLLSRMLAEFGVTLLA